MKLAPPALLAVAVLLITESRTATALLCRKPCQGDACRTDLDIGDKCGGPCHPHGVCDESKGLFCKVEAQPSRRPKSPQGHGGVAYVGQFGRPVTGVCAKKPTDQTIGPELGGK